MVVSSITCVLCGFTPPLVNQPDCHSARALGDAFVDCIHLSENVLACSSHRLSPPARREALYSQALRPGPCPAWLRVGVWQSARGMRGCTRSLTLRSQPPKIKRPCDACDNSPRVRRNHCPDALAIEVGAVEYIWSIAVQLEYMGIDTGWPTTVQSKTNNKRV